MSYRLGNGINWKSQVYPALKNYDAENPVSGITNILKRHYQVNPPPACLMSLEVRALAARCLLQLCALPARFAWPPLNAST